jgi:predicted nucleotidyltransferase
MIPPKMDIQPKDLSIVESILKKYLPSNTTVWIFGSRAKNHARKFSDLDLAIDAGKKLPATTLTNIKFDLEESDLPYKVDVIDWNTISKNFKNLISKDLTVLCKT